MTSFTLSGKNVALAGRFKLIGKGTVSADAKRRGFSAQASLNGKTDILIIPTAGTEEAAVAKAQTVGAEVLTERDYLIWLALTPALSEPAGAKVLLDRIRSMVSELYADPRTCITCFRLPPGHEHPWVSFEEPTLTKLFEGMDSLELRWIARANPAFDPELHESVGYIDGTDSFDGAVNIPSASAIDHGAGWGRPFIADPNAIFHFHDLGLSEREFFEALRPFDLFSPFWPVGLLERPDGEVRVFVGDDEGASWDQPAMTAAEYLEQVIQTHAWTGGRAFGRAVSLDELLTKLLPASWPERR